MTDPQAGLLDALDVAVVVQGPDLRLVYANRRAAEMLGISTAEFIDRTSHDARWDVIDADGVPVSDEGHPGVRAVRTGQPVRGVLLGVKRADADRVWIMASAIPEFDADGAVTRVVITFSDVSVTQRAANEKGSIYQVVFRSMSEGLVIHEPDGSIRAANEAAERVLGLTVDQMSGRAATDPRWRLMKPDGSAVDAEYIPSEVARTTGEPVESRLIGVHRPSGEVAWLSVRADPLRELGDERLRGVVATFTDVTREHRTRDALIASQAQAQRVLDAIPGVVYQYLHPLAGPDRFVFVAGRIHELFGLDPEQARARPELIFTLLAETDQRDLTERITSAVSQGTVFEHELPFTRANGGARWARIRGVPEPTADGLLYTGVIVDVTDARQLAEALRRTQRRESMAQMAAGIAHNFNNMLAVIVPNIEVARGAVDPAHGEMLADAERAALSAADLVRRMLALGRAETGPRDAGADLVPLLREAIHICRQTFDRGIAIQDDVTVSAAGVRGSPSELQQVVLNLCLNARDAMAGCARRVLHVSLAADGPSAVLLTVRYTGVGMSAETLRRLGEPFFSTKEPGRGTGLGLASAFNAITEAGGTWTVTSEPGQGTTFAIRLPTMTTLPAAVTVDAAPATATVSGSVMIVDDEPMVRATVARLLTHIGYEPILAANSDEALQLLSGPEASDLKALLLDLSMPKLSGEQLLPLLKARVPHVPVIVLSGYVDDRAMLEGASAVLQKPVGVRALEETLRSIVRTR